ncbi:hypothetical protein KC363_g909 [Hortaea werneckii]|uniref:GCN5-related N-acetyltransferase Rv2170-like domain-containing protein n=1 Tax=Hortaea werneckii TaxID=91943 RepID=A0A3M7F9W6_HORWE|nr:hypothetical protein KC361_g2598 [Hortaea werneckii]KAI6888481.1 hypothetical protein KC325_g1346 [Hortaea werneckii]KAI6997394.1 hypothetical protein KC359_g3015 [Hortaea werneckii]KAI7148205.1 hypothetical protein KC344_g2165 [Hortaea werneckii]KAI7178085.1 hypothetical protein KC360_g1866 [Hortaea werneckii]
MSSKAPPKLHRHHLAPSGLSRPILDAALRVLRPHIPTSIPLYRRLQFGRFFPDSLLFTNLDLGATSTSIDRHASNGTDAGSKQTDHHPHEEPWLIAFVDRTCRPETEVWVFGSWENSPPASSLSPTARQEEWQAIDNLVAELVEACRDLPVPRSIHQDILDEQQSQQREAGDTDAALTKTPNPFASARLPTIQLWGAIHTTTASVLERLDVLAETSKVNETAANHTFIFDVPSLAPPPPLSEGLEWGEVKKEYFALVRSKSEIPRWDRTMASLPSLAIYPAGNGGSGAPVAWAFIGLDTSVTTLHVEPEWRGRGLGKAVTAKLFKQGMQRFWEDGVQRLAHGYVVMGNKASEGMMKSLGGIDTWKCYWLRVDLEKAGKT